MYGLPKDIDLNFFIGRTLVQVCVGSNDLILNFDGEVSVTVTSSVGCMGSSGKLTKYDDFREAAPEVLMLLDRAVVSAKGDEGGTLALEYDGGRHLQLYDDTKQYESYTIRNGGKVIVV